ncbi:hypothetical protein FDUTEX481_08435 [Tolypothrix sp. PCC 7601]|nr:hypothetical protein FDUTEX481_08435 [Tolypothrix sp. PCC 7601]
MEVSEVDYLKLKISAIFLILSMETSGDRTSLTYRDRSRNTMLLNSQESLFLGIIVKKPGNCSTVLSLNQYPKRKRVYLTSCDAIS